MLLYNNYLIKKYSSVQSVTNKSYIINCCCSNLYSNIFFINIYRYIPTETNYFDGKSVNLS